MAVVDYLRPVGSVAAETTLVITSQALIILSSLWCYRGWNAVPSVAWLHCSDSSLKLEPNGFVRRCSWKVTVFWAFVFFLFWHAVFKRLRHNYYPFFIKNWNMSKNVTVFHCGTCVQVTWVQLRHGCTVRALQLNLQGKIIVHECGKLFGPTGASDIWHMIEVMNFIQHKNTIM